MKKQKLEHKENGMKKALKNKLFSPNKILKKKRLPKVNKKTVSELLKEKRKDLNLTGVDAEMEEIHETSAGKIKIFSY